MKTPSINQAIRVEHSISKFPGGKIIHTYSIQIGTITIHNDESFDHAIDYYLEQLGSDEREKGDYSNLSKGR